MEYHVARNEYLITWGYPSSMSFYGKTATVRLVIIAYLYFSYIFPMQTIKELFGVKNINKPVPALGPYIQGVYLLILQSLIFPFIIQQNGHENSLSSQVCSCIVVGNIQKRG